MIKKRGPKKGTTQKIHTRKYKSGKVKTIINGPHRKKKK
jgi:hypothetical protein